MRIYTIRHGETDANRDGLLQGRIDFDLNESGVALAQITGEALRGTRFDACFSSPLLRAHHTAELILEHSGNTDTEIFHDDRLREISMGDWEGKKVRDADGHYASELLRLFFTDAFHCGTFPHGESVQEVCDRTQGFLRELAAKDYENVLVSMHGCTLRAMLNCLYEDKADFWHRHVPYNCVVNIIEVKDGRMELVEDDRIYYDPDQCVDRYVVK